MRLNVVAWGRRDCDAGKPCVEVEQWQAEEVKVKYVIRHFIAAFEHPSNWREWLWLVSDAASAFVLLIGLISVAGYLFDDPRLYEGWFPGAVGMAPQTAMCFIAVGFALLTNHRTPSG